MRADLFDSVGVAQALLAAMATTPSGAMLVTNYAGQVMDSIDMFRVVRYILSNYESYISSQTGQTGQMGQTTAVGQERYTYW